MKVYPFMIQQFRVYRYLPWFVFALAVLSLSCFVIPMYVIRPFRHQNENELRVALFVKQVGPLLSISCAVLAFVTVIAIWKELAGWFSRSAVVLALVLAICGSYLARLNVYELMFHPLGAPQFESIQEAHLEQEDMVIAVRLNNVSRAYPIREMAYHHIVNDTVGGVPIVSTY